MQSPQFATTYEGINQSVDIKITTVACQAAPEPVVALYDFIMTTFVPEGNTPPAPQPSLEETPAESQEISEVGTTDESKINVVLKFAGVRGKWVIQHQGV